jgi:hypothetical protein
MAGVEEPALADLAGLPATASGWDTDPLVSALYAQYDVPIPSGEDAVAVLARLMANRPSHSPRNRDRADDPGGGQAGGARARVRPRATARWLRGIAGLRLRDRQSRVRAVPGKPFVAAVAEQPGSRPGSIASVYAPPGTASAWPLTRLPRRRPDLPPVALPGRCPRERPVKPLTGPAWVGSCY